MSKEILLVWQGTNDKIAAKIKKLDEERNQLLSRLNTISNGWKIIAYNVLHIKNIKTIFYMQNVGRNGVWTQTKSRKIT